MEQINERPVRQRRTNQQILQLLDQFDKSKLTVKDFCRQHSISTGNFHKWKSRNRSNAVGKNKHSAFAALDIVSASQTRSPILFAEVRDIKIYLPVSASFLRELQQ